MDEKFPQNLKFTKEHEWSAIADNVATIGITHHAQDALGEIVFVDLPEVGTELKQGDTFGAVESIKAVSDLYAPLSGKVVAVNEELPDNPGSVNSDPQSEAWMIKLELSNSTEVSELLDADAYKAFVDSL